MGYDISKISFKGDLAFLSNMYPATISFLGEECGLSEELFPFEFDGSKHKSSEHLYQSLKSHDPKWKALVASTSSAKKVKTLARKHLNKDYAIRDDWAGEVRIDAMRCAVYLKFIQNPQLAKKLIRFKGTIIEKNCWGDTFWGECEGEGSNNLGILIMEVRILLLSMEAAMSEKGFLS